MDQAFRFRCIALSLVLSLFSICLTPPLHAAERSPQKGAAHGSMDRLVPLRASTRALAVDIIAIKMGSRAVPNLSESLVADKEEIVRIAAAIALSRIGSAAVPALVEALHSEADCVWLLAMSALGQIGSPAVSELAKALRTPDARMRYRSTLTLGVIGRVPRDVMIMLRELSESDPDGSVQWAVQNVLERVEVP